jgi:hypothetical protein
MLRCLSLMLWCLLQVWTRQSSAALGCCDAEHSTVRHSHDYGVCGSQSVILARRLQALAENKEAFNRPHHFITQHKPITSMKGRANVHYRRPLWLLDLLFMYVNVGRYLLLDAAKPCLEANLSAGKGKGAERANVG